MRGVQAVGFSKRFGETLAVDDFSALFEFGKTACIMGRNGAGKTTLLKAICGIFEGDSGKILIDGQESSSVEAKRKTAFSAESPQFAENCLVKEYLEEIFSLVSPEGESPQKVGEAIEKFALKEAELKKISSLSKGFRQRLSLAQCFLKSPSVYVLDEPASGLDPAQISQMRAFVGEAKKSAAVIVSTHLVQEALAIGDKIFIMERGRLAAQGTPDEIATQAEEQNLEKAFLKIAGIGGA